MYILFCVVIFIRMISRRRIARSKDMLNTATPLMVHSNSYIANFPHILAGTRYYQYFSISARLMIKNGIILTSQPSFHMCTPFTFPFSDIYTPKCSMNHLFNKFEILSKHNNKWCIFVGINILNNLMVRSMLWVKHCAFFLLYKAHIAQQEIAMQMASPCVPQLRLKIDLP